MARLRVAAVFGLGYGGVVFSQWVTGAGLSGVGLAIVAAATLACVGVGLRAGWRDVTARAGADFDPDPDADPDRRPLAVALALVILVGLGFWSGFAAVLTLLGVGEPGAAIGPALVVGLVGVSVLALAPISMLLARRGLEPSPVTRLAVGVLALALACVCVAARVELGGASLVGAGAVALALAAAFAGPASVAAIEWFARADQRGPWLAAWISSLVLGRGLGALLAGRAVAAGQVFECCLALGFVAVASAVSSSSSWRPLRALDDSSSAAGVLLDGRVGWR